jgi:hypothetical protein
MEAAPLPAAALLAAESKLTSNHRQSKIDLVHMQAGE